MVCAPNRLQSEGATIELCRLPLGGRVAIHFRLCRSAPFLLSSATSRGERILSHLRVVPTPTDGTLVARARANNLYCQSARPTTGDGSGINWLNSHGNLDRLVIGRILDVAFLDFEEFLEPQSSRRFEANIVPELSTSDDLQLWLVTQLLGTIYPGSLYEINETSTSSYPRGNWPTRPPSPVIPSF